MEREREKDRERESVCVCERQRERERGRERRMIVLGGLSLLSKSDHHCCPAEEFFISGRWPDLQQPQAESTKLFSGLHLRTCNYYLRLIEDLLLTVTSLCFKN